MSDLISRQAAIDALAKFVPYVIDDVSTESYSNGLTDAYNLICQLPSAQAEIIRCKDCKHWRKGTSFSYCDKLHGMGVLDALDYMTAEDDYCSMAERREE